MDKVITYKFEHDNFCLSPKATHFAYTNSGTKLVVVDLLDGTKKEFPIKLEVMKLRSPMCFISDSEVLIVDIDMNIVKINFATSERLTIYVANNYIKSIDYKDGYIAAGIEKKVHIINLKGEVIHELKGCRSTVNSCKFLNCSNKVAATGDKKIHIWDLSEKNIKSKPIATLDEKGYTITVSENKPYIHVSSFGISSVVVYDYSTYEMIHRVDDCLYSCLHNDQLIVSAKYLHNEHLTVEPRYLYDLVNMQDKTKMPVAYLSENLKGHASSSNGTLALRYFYGASFLYDTKRDYFEPGIANMSKVFDIYRWGNMLLTCGDSDLVLRDIHGVGVKSLYFRLLGKFHSFQETASPNIIWLVASENSILFDIENWSVVTETGRFKGDGRKAFRANGHTVFSMYAHRGYSMLVAFDDNGKKLYQHKKLDIHVSEAFSINDEYVLIDSEYRSIFRTKDKTLSLLTIHPKAFTYGIFSDSEKKLVYAIETESHNSETGELKLIFTCQEVFVNDRYVFKIPCENFIAINWLKKNETFLFANEFGDLSIFHCEDQSFTRLDVNCKGIESALAIDSDKVALGLVDGNVKIITLS